MSNAYWGYWLVLLGVFIVVVLLLIQNVTTANVQNASLIKEISEAAMIDSVDYAYYRDYGEIKINAEKFEETFTRRMAEIVTGGTTYKIEFHRIYESPPAIALDVSSRSSTFNIFGDETTFDLTDRVEAILEGSIKG